MLLKLFLISGFLLKVSSVDSCVDPVGTVAPEFVCATESAGLRNKTIRIISTVTIFSDYFYIGPPGIEAIRFALNKLSLQPDWLPGYNLEWEIIDDHCLDEGAIIPLIAKFQNNGNEPRFPLALLSECEINAQLIPARILADFNYTGLLTIVASIDVEQRRHKFSNLMTFVPRPDYFFVGLIALFKDMGWTRVLMASELDTYYEEVRH